MIFIYTTCSNMSEAEKIGELLVENKAVACVNFWPINSVYPWKGEIHKDNEAVLLIKTVEENKKQAQDLIRKNHSYETPFIGVMNIDANKEYVEYMKSIL